MSETTVILKLDTNELTMLTSSLEKYEEYIINEKETMKNLFNTTSSARLKKTIKEHLNTLDKQLNDVDELVGVIEKSLDAKIEYEVMYRE